jgi:hypothetical protein
VVIELIELHLPAHLARFVPVVNGVNRGIHLTRRALRRALATEPAHPADDPKWNRRR